MCGCSHLGVGRRVRLGRRGREFESCEMQLRGSIFVRAESWEFWPVFNLLLDEPDKSIDKTCPSSVSSPRGATRSTSEPSWLQSHVFTHFKMRTPAVPPWISHFCPFFCQIFTKNSKKPCQEKIYLQPFKTTSQQKLFTCSTNKMWTLIPPIPR